MDPYHTTSGPNKFIVFLFGLLVGVAILAGYLFVSDRFLNKEEEKSDVKVTPTKEFALSLANPKDGETVSTDKIKLTGSTGVASVLVVNGGKEDTVIESADGAFSIDYGLNLGENQITVVAYDEVSGESRTETIDVLYLNEDLESL